MDISIYLTPVVKRTCKIAVKDQEFVDDITNADPMATFVLKQGTDMHSLLLYSVYTGWVLAKRGKEEYQKLYLLPSVSQGENLF